MTGPGSVVGGASKRNPAFQHRCRSARYEDLCRVGIGRPAKLYAGRYDARRVANQSRSLPGAVRIIGGAWRSRKLPIPAGSTVRPTPDRVRETLFNWIGPLLPGAACVDLYAGTGVLGLEALSRGAARAVFVERDAAVASAIEEACRVLEASAEVIRADARDYLDRPGIGPFDLAFVDPPYSTSVLPVFESLPAVLAAGAHVYLERERGGQWPESDRIEWVRRGSAGAVEYGLAVVRS